MPKRRKQEFVNCRYFGWLIGRRDEGGVFYADGRTNELNVGRHSLGTKDKSAALATLRELDLKMAVKHGRAEASLLHTEQKPLEIEAGIKLYMEHVQRPRVLHGASKSTAKRYQAVFDKFRDFSLSAGVRSWQEVTRRHLVAYGRWLEDEDYAYRSKYLELTTVKQAANWLINEKYLPESCRFTLRLAKATGTETYCYRDAEVAAMISHCSAKFQLCWLGDVIIALAYTGLRISELAQLRWSAVDLENNVLRVIDNTRLSKDAATFRETTTKTHASRTLPIHAELRRILEKIERHSDGRVFHGARGGALKPDVVRVALVRDVLKPLAKQFPTRAGEPNLLSGRVHSFRHYFCSRCARAKDGPREQTLMEWLGHRDSAMIRHYFHLYDDDAQRQMSRLQAVNAFGAA